MHYDMLKIQGGVAVVEKLNSYLISNAFSFEFYSISSKTVYIFGGTEDIFAPLIYILGIYYWWDRKIFMPSLIYIFGGNERYLCPLSRTSTPTPTSYAPVYILGRCHSGKLCIIRNSILI